MVKDLTMEIIMTGEVKEVEVKEMSKWQHKNGSEYVVLHLANLDSDRLDDYPVTVVYINILNYKVWTRKLSDWHRSMTFVEQT